MLILSADLDVVDAAHIGDAGSDAQIHQPAILPHAGALTDAREAWIGRQVGEWVGARIVVVLILPHKSTEGEHGLRIDKTSPDGRNVKRCDLRALIGRANR